MTGEREDLGVWPVRLTIGGATGWSLCFPGEPDVLLARAGRVALVGSPDGLVGAVAREAGTFWPAAVARIEEDALQRIVGPPAMVVDFDEVARWFADPDREVTLGACHRALDAMNMAIDIGATVGDQLPAALIDSDALSDVHDALTFGLTLLGDDGPFRDDPAAMVAILAPGSAAAVSRLVGLVRDHIDFMSPA